MIIINLVLLLIIMTNKYFGKKEVPGEFIYEGEFVDNKMVGKGLKIWLKNNKRYIGDFLNDEPHGYGTLTYQNGDIYEGEFKNGEPDGVGVFKWSNYIYEGEFQNGTFHGEGDLTHKNVKTRVTCRNGKFY